MLSRNHCVQYADTVMVNANRLPLDEHAELLAQHNVNLTSDGEDDAWLDSDPTSPEVAALTILEEIEFWNMVDNYIQSDSNHD